MRRAVVDTNVFLSALLGGRGTLPVLEALVARRFSLLTSQPLLDELVALLSRPEWLRILEPARCREVLTVIREAATFVTPRKRLTVCRDPGDNVLLECALVGRADYLVTGDKDLLVLDPFRGTRILRPADFLRLLS